jgi:hypothetical protein
MCFQEFWSKFFEARRLHTGQDNLNDRDETLPELAKQSNEHAQSSDAHVSAAGQRKAHVRKDVDLTAIEAPSLMSGLASSKGTAEPRPYVYVCVCVNVCVCV